MAWNTQTILLGLGLMQAVPTIHTAAHVYKTRHKIVAGATQVHSVLLPETKMLIAMKTTLMSIVAHNVKHYLAVARDKAFATATIPALAFLVFVMKTVDAVLAPYILLQTQVVVLHPILQ